MIEALKTFIAIVEEGGFTKASKKINLSQPAVSAQIKALEKYFNTELIIRSNKRLIIKENGYVLYNKAKEIVKLFDETKEAVKNNSGDIQGTLKIGATYTIGECIIPDVLARFTEVYPKVRVETYIAGTSDIMDKVKDMKVDIGLIEGMVHCNTIDQVFFQEDELVLLVSEHHPFAGKEVKIEELSNERWIMREEGSGTRSYLDLFLSKHKIVPESMVVLGSNTLVLKGIQKGMGITIASKRLLNEPYKGIAMASLPEKFNRSLSYILPQNSYVSSIVPIFASFLNSP